MIYQIILITINLYRKDLECEVHSEVSFFNNKIIFPVHPEAILAVFFLTKNSYYEDHPFAAEVDEYSIFTTKNANSY